MLENRVHEIRGKCPVKLGLTKPEELQYAYMQCVDPGEPYTHGSTEVFKCNRIKGKSDK